MSAKLEPIPEEDGEVYTITVSVTRLIMQQSRDFEGHLDRLLAHIKDEVMEKYHHWQGERECLRTGE